MLENFAVAFWIVLSATATAGVGFVVFRSDGRLQLKSALVNSKKILEILGSLGVGYLVVSLVTTFAFTDLPWQGRAGIGPVRLQQEHVTQQDLETLAKEIEALANNPDLSEAAKAKLRLGHIARQLQAAGTEGACSPSDRLSSFSSCRRDLNP